MYAVIFEAGKEPEIWETGSGWPGTYQMRKPEGTCVYFPETDRWKVWKENSSCPMVLPHEIPAEYRVAALLLT